LPRAVWGAAFAHAGIGIALMGIVCETTWNTEYIGTMKAGDSVVVAGYQLTLEGLVQQQGPNYRETAAPFDVRSHGERIANRNNLFPYSRELINRL